MDEYEPVETRRIYIKGLNRRTTEKSLRAFFQQWGEIEEAELKDQETGQLRGFAFIKYKRSFMAKQAVGKHKFDGYQVTAAMQNPKRNIREPPGGWIKLEDVAVDEKLGLIPATGLNKLKFIDYVKSGQLKRGSVRKLPEFCKQVTGALAIDCEMVGVGPTEESALARVSIVNEWGFCLLDTFVKPEMEVTNYRTKVSGIREKNLIKAMPFAEARSKVAEILEGKILVGHGVQHDLKVLSIIHPPESVRDTADYFSVPNQRTPSLKLLADHLLRMEIQQGEHSSIQDAQAAMKLYLIYRQGWEASLGH